MRIVISRFLPKKRYFFPKTQTILHYRISSSAVSAYEADQISPSLETLVKLANLFHVSTDYLLGVDYPRDKAVLDTSGLNKQQLTVLQNLIDIMK
ncbi:helix-turn-helix transcriptional regulator [Lachnospiraceae bacterium MD335]|nr:helix-turn-helix transcriptional regulator [Lachnospiraceae bacterium MD335]